MCFIGVDLSKRKFSTVFLDQGDRPIHKRSFNINKKGLSNFISLLDKSDIMAIEAGTNSFYFYDLMKPYVKEVKVINTYAFRVIKNSIKKSDLNDAHLIAKFLKYGELPEIFVPEKKYRDLRELIHFRDKLVQTRTKMRNMVTSTLQKEGFLIGRKELDNHKNRGGLLRYSLSEVGRMEIEIAISQIEKINHDIERVENRIKQFKRSDIKIKNDLIKLLQIPGIGELTAITILGELGGNVERFGTKKQISAYAGLVTKTYQSGDTLKHKKVTRGRRLLKKTMIQIVLTQVGRYNNPIVDFYCFKKKQKCVGKAAMAAARKLLIVIYIMLKYNKDYHQVNDELYARKLRKLKFNQIA